MNPFDTLEYSLTTIALMTVLGVITHWMKQIMLARKSASMTPLSVRSYWVTYWPETIAAATSSVAGVALMQELGYLTPAVAFGVGYLGNSAADLIGGRVQAMISAAAPGGPRNPES
jgi:uncharacterized membrane protein